MRLFLVIAALWVNVAYGADVTIAYGRGVHALSAHEVRELSRGAARRWSEATGERVRLRFRRFKARSRVLQDSVALSLMVPRRQYASGRRTLFVLPPVRRSEDATRDTSLIAGFAGVCGTWGWVAVTSKERFGPLHRLAHAEAAIAHELGHLLGAGHDDESVMDVAVLHKLQGWGFRWEISDKSAREVRMCGRGR